MMALSDYIGQIAGELEANVTAGTAMPVHELRATAVRLRSLERLAYNLEEELGVYRLGEAERLGRPMVEQLAAEQFDGLARDGDGKVLRPDFGGRKP